MMYCVTIFQELETLGFRVFRQRIAALSVCLKPASSAELFVSQLETDITGILDELVPVCTYTKRQGKTDIRWLSPEAITANQKHRRLERRGKKTRLEAT